MGATDVRLNSIERVYNNDCPPRSRRLGGPLKTKGPTPSRAGPLIKGRKTNQLWRTPFEPKRLALLPFALFRPSLDQVSAETAEPAIASGNGIEEDTPVLPSPGTSTPSIVNSDS
jgi:hypothetical protein